MEPPVPQIEAYQFGCITIDGETYTRDLIICPDGIPDFSEDEKDAMCYQTAASVYRLHG